MLMTNEVEDNDEMNDQLIIQPDKDIIKQIQKPKEYEQEEDQKMDMKEEENRNSEEKPVQSSNEEREHLLLQPQKPEIQNQDKNLAIDTSSEESSGEINKEKIKKFSPKRIRINNSLLPEVTPSSNLSTEFFNELLSNSTSLDRKKQLIMMYL